MLLQQAPANTFSYMVFGFVVIFGSMGVYLLSLIVRRRNFQQDLELLKDLEEEQKGEQGK